MSKFNCAEERRKKHTLECACSLAVDTEDRHPPFGTVEEASVPNRRPTGPNPIRPTLWFRREREGDNQWSPLGLISAQILFCVPFDLMCVCARACARARVCVCVISIVFIVSGVSGIAVHSQCWSTFRQFRSVTHTHTHTWYAYQHRSHTTQYTYQARTLMNVLYWNTAHQRKFWINVKKKIKK